MGATSSIRKQVGRKIVRKDRAKAYRKIKKQKETIVQMKRKIESLKRKLKRKQAKVKPISLTPNSKVDALIQDIDVTPEVRKNLLFCEALTTQLRDKSDTSVFSRS